MVGRSLVLVAALGGLTAMEEAPSRRVEDVRVIGAVVDGYEFLDVDGESGQRVGLGWFHSFVDDFEGDVTGLMLGIEVAAARADIDELTVSDVAATLHAGLAWQTDVRQLHLELGPLFGVGRNRFEADSGDTYGTYYEAGFRGALFWTFDMGLQVGVDGRWQTARAYTDVGIERRSAESRGFAAGVVVGWRL